MKWVEILSSPILDRVGMTTIATTVGITAAKTNEALEVVESWGMPDYALLISMIGGLLFIIAKVLEIIEKSISIKKAKK